MELHSEFHPVFERSFPTPETTRALHDQQALQRAVEAYRFFYPTVSMEGFFEGSRKAGIEDGKGILTLAVTPRHIILTANSDTPYAGTTWDLRGGPMVVELPAGPYVALVNDHNQGWVLDMGIPGPDAGKGGKYLVLPPGFSGKVPDGYHVGSSPTYKILVAVRAIPQRGGRAAALEALRKVKVHALEAPGMVLPFIDATERDLDATLLRWEDNLEYWKRLHAVIEAEPAIEEFMPMYGELAAVGIAKGRPFAPSERMRTILERAAREALAQMRVEAFDSHRPERMVWKDRRWEWATLVPGSAAFEMNGAIDLRARDRWFFQAILTSPAMFRRQVGGGSIYFLGARDRTGAFLDGARTYKLTLPGPVPAQLFWSLTAYDAKTRSQVQTAQNRAVLGSLEDEFPPGKDGAIELFLGPARPAGHEKQWIQTPPASGYFTYLRIYGPQAACLDGTWRPGDPTPM
jgi:hypothetical protein